MTASRAKFLENKEHKKKIRNEKKDHVTKLEGKKKEMDSVKVSQTQPRPSVGLSSHTSRALTPSSPFALQLADSMKRYSYLLGQTDLFEHFLTIKVRPELTSLSPPTCRAHD